MKGAKSKHLCSHEGCDRAYYYKKSLEKHIQVDHPKEEPKKKTDEIDLKPVETKLSGLSSSDFTQLVQTCIKKTKEKSKFHQELLKKPESKYGSSSFTEHDIQSNNTARISFRKVNDPALDVVSNKLSENFETTPSFNIIAKHSTADESLNPTKRISQKNLSTISAMRRAAFSR